jgi:hypothetical protein
MTHALADVVHAEQFPIYLGDHDLIAVACPQCPGWEVDLGEMCDTLVGYQQATTIGSLLAEAHRHIAEAHTVAPDYADSYPALIPEAQLADDETTAAVRVCDATGNTVRGPLLPVELDGRRLWLCRVCFAAYRRSVSHLDDPLPLTEGPVL